MSVVTTTNTPITDPDSVTPLKSNLRGVYLACERVIERMQRAEQALRLAGVEHAIIGGHAVAAWVSTINPEATRYTKDVDLLVSRADLETIKTVLHSAGFVYCDSEKGHFFLDGPDGKYENGLHLVFAAEPVKSTDLINAPTLHERELLDGRSVISLAALLRMKLTAFRLKDQMHLVDLAQLGLINQTWVSRFEEPLASRLQQIIDSPEVTEAPLG
jgi:hypothetical protein